MGETLLYFSLSTPLYFSLCHVVRHDRFYWRTDWREHTAPCWHWSRSRSGRWWCHTDLSWQRLNLYTMDTWMSRRSAAHVTAVPHPGCSFWWCRAFARAVPACPSVTQASGSNSGNYIVPVWDLSI